ncbi:hypothetical protein [Pseudomonas huanghezhanensis]|uniref:hypothetical protein n=1 Tax=Pseudomonas huanghezhanensis TaxID=3002903 RepID=UPI002285FDD6|nr:hypothetical protein [Pseudomonas sp. BSw22131]
MNYVNNWITQLNADMQQAATVLPISASAVALLGNGEYRLTLVNSLNPVEQSAWEIIALKKAGGVVTVSRAQENTGAQFWPMGTVIYCSITAGGINRMAEQIADLVARVAVLEAGGGDGGGGVTPAPDGALTSDSGDLLEDEQNNQLVGE